FDRTSLSATVGWGAAKTIAGDPSPIAQEIMVIHPALAVVMLGTNDTYPTGVDPFERNLRANVDKLLAFGVLPIVTTIPQRSDTAEAIALLPEMNAIIRAVAQAKQVPFIDLAAALAPLPGYGLASDGIHLQVYSSGGAHGCWFTPDALKLGMNQRNLLTLTALDRVRRYVLERSAGAEPAPASLAGKGVWLDPLVVDAIPFVDDRDPRTDGIDQTDAYACGTQDESGPEVVYRVELAAAAKLRIRVFSDEGADLDVHWLDGEGASSCTARADKMLDVDAKAGVHRLVVDTFSSGGVAKVGRYRLTLVKL
ncbi:MAG: SGNH/GDSL hydrolase family protein, partial [Polyangiales bacterium]